jgi:hypothetical protein
VTFDLLSWLAGIATGVAANWVYDLIRKKLRRQTFEFSYSSSDLRIEGGVSLTYDEMRQFTERVLGHSSRASGESAHTYSIDEFSPSTDDGTSEKPDGA